MNPDPVTQIYEKDVILEDDYEQMDKDEQNEYMDKRAKTGDDIEREELSDEEV